MIGLNGRLDSIQAAVLLEKLSIFDDELEMRNEVDSNYRKYLNNAQYHPEELSICSCFVFNSIRIKNKRDNLIDSYLKKKYLLLFIINFQFI